MRLLFTIILFIQPIFAEKIHSISGMVINEEGIPIQNVFIQVEGLDIASTTDATGYFLLPLEDPGAYQLTFKHIAYKEHAKRLDSRTKEIKIITLKINTIPATEVVVTSKRKKSKIKDSPILTHIINKEEMKENSYSTVEEVIEFAMPNVQSTHDNHGEEKIKIQGLDSKYIMFLVDGNKVSGEFAGNIDFSLFNMNNIERIEVIRGGLSTVYGSGAMGGVINIITQDNINSMWLSYNSFYDMPKIFTNALEIGFKIKKFSYALNVNYNRTDGYDLTENDFDSGSSFEINKTQEEYSSISFDHKLKYIFNKYSSIKLIYKDYSKDINKYEFVLGKKFFQSELPKFNDKIVTLIYNKSFKNNSSISFTYQNENHSKSYYFPYYYSSSPTVTNPDPDIDGETYLWSNPKVTNSSILYNFELKNYSLLSGIDYVYQSYRSIDVLSEDGSILVQSIFDENKTKNMDELSFFMLSSYSSNKRYAIDLGIRFNYHSKYKIKLSPSISAKNTIDDYIYRMNYSQNYRSPSLKELYYNFGDHPGGFPIIGNQNLKPSTSDYFSFSLESIKRLNNSLEIYYNHVTNMIANRFEELSAEDSTIVYRYHNYKSVDLYGLHLNLFFHPLKNISIKSVYSYTNANSKHRDVIDGISAHSINMQLKYNVIETVDFIISTKYNSDKTVDISLEDENNQRTEITLPPYYVFNASCIKNFKSGNYIKFGVKNIFNYIDSNSEAPDFLSSYEPGRRFFININFNLSKGIK